MAAKSGLCCNSPQSRNDDVCAGCQSTDDRSTVLSVKSDRSFAVERGSVAIKNGTVVDCCTWPMSRGDKFPRHCRPRHLTVSYKIEAENQKVKYTYDNFKRVVVTQHYSDASNDNSEDPWQRVQSAYNDIGMASDAFRNRNGRLMRVQTGGVNCANTGNWVITDQFGYNASGQMTKKRLLMNDGGGGGVPLDARWAYDNEGHMTTQVPPNWLFNETYFFPYYPGMVRYVYDNLGRVNAVNRQADNMPGVSRDPRNPDVQGRNQQAVISGITRGVAGELTAVTGPSGAITYTYNSLFQMTQVNVNERRVAATPVTGGVTNWGNAWV